LASSPDIKKSAKTLTKHKPTKESNTINDLIKEIMNESGFLGW
jgi:hypothetical protein